MADKEEKKSVMAQKVEELHKLRAEIKKMGGEEKVAKQHARGKLTARERVDLLFDKDSFLEVGIMGTEPGGKRVPADAVITGYGKVNGRYVAVAAYDFTVKGGSMGMVNELKVTRMRQIALRERFPFVWLSDSGGARIDPSSAASFGGGELSALFADSGYLFKEESLMSGVIPLVCAMMGPGFAGTAYIPGLADFVPMVKGRCSMGLGGPALVKMVTGEDISEEDLGGSKVHCEISGCGDLEVDSDEACIEAIRKYLSYFPQHCEEKPPRAPWEGDPNALMDDKILKVVPDNTRQAFDMHKVIKFIADEGDFFEIKPKWARNIIVGFLRIGGFPVGVVANNPMFYAGAIDINASDKAARFIWLCDAFNIPLLFLSDAPGFMVGSKAEKDGIIRHGAKFVHAVAEATVPKLTVVVRKSYGAAYYAMCGRAFDPDLLVAWPGAEIAVMGPEGMVSIFAKRALDAAQNPEERAKMTLQMAEQIRPFVQIDKVANWSFVDDVIDPRETRRVLIAALELTKEKKIFRHPRKHGVYPV